MEGNGHVIAAYAAYAAIAVALTALLARTLFRNGAVFLEDVFEDRPALAQAVNRLLVTGFYMANLGYAFWVLREGRGLDAFGAVQYLVNRLALLLLVLAGLHLINVTVLWKIRGRREQRRMPTPVAPQVVLPTPPPPAKA